MEIGQLLMSLGQAPSDTKATVERSGAGGKEVFSQLLQLLMKEDTSKLLLLLEDLANDKQFANKKDVIEDLIKKLSKMQQETANDKNKMTSNSTLLQDVAFLLLSQQQVLAAEPVADDVVNEDANLGIGSVDKVVSATGANDGPKRKVLKQENLPDINVDVSSKDSEMLSGKVQSVKNDGATEVSIKEQEKGSIHGISQARAATKGGKLSKKIAQVIEDDNISNVTASDKFQGKVAEKVANVSGTQWGKEKDNASIVIPQDGKDEVVTNTAEVHEKKEESLLMVVNVIEKKAVANRENHDVRGTEGVEDTQGRERYFASQSNAHLANGKVKHKARCQILQTNHMYRQGLTQEAHTTQIFASSENPQGTAIDINTMHHETIHGKIQDTQIPQPVDGDKYRITDPIEVVPITADEWEHTEKEVIVDKKLLKDTVEKLIKSHDNSQDNKSNVKDVSQGMGKVLGKGLTQTHISGETKGNALFGLKEATISRESRLDTVDEETFIENKAEESSVEVKPAVSENTEVKKEKSSDVLEARLHKHVEADIVKMSTITNEDKQVSHEKQLIMRTINSFAKAVEIMKSKHKYPAYIAIRVNDNIVKMKLSFDIEKGEFLLEMMADKDMAQVIHGQRHLLVGALMERDIHVRDVKVYIANESSMMGLRQDTRHMNWSFMGHNGSWHSYRQQHDYATWVRDVYGSAHEMPVVMTDPYSAPARIAKGAGINIYA